MLQVGLFIFILTITSFHNHALIKSADKRLEKANEMVNTLARSCDSLAKVNVEIKDLALSVKKDYIRQLEEMRKIHDMEIKELATNRDDYKQAYTALLERYNELDKALIDGYKKIQESHFRTIHDMAVKPTINNNNLSDK